MDMTRLDSHCQAILQEYRDNLPRFREVAAKVNDDLSTDEIIYEQGGKSRTPSLNHWEGAKKQDAGAGSSNLFTNIVNKLFKNTCQRQGMVVEYS